MALEYDTREEEALVARCLAGEVDAFAPLVRRYEGQAYQLALRYTGDPETARDAVQEAFVRAFRSLGKFRRGSKFYTWLYRIVMNICIDLHRKKPKAAILSLEENLTLADRDDSGGLSSPPPPPDLLAEKMETAEKVRRAIDTLPEDQRATVLLHSIEGFSRKEVARIMGCPVETVKSRLSLARRKLRDKLKHMVI